MVEPVSDEEKERFYLRLKVGAALLVAVSAVLITLQSGAGPLGLAAAGGLGFLVGLVLVWFTFPSSATPDRN